MSPSFFLNIIITVILATVLYIVLPFVASDISNQVSAVIGVLVGGFAIPLIETLFSNVSTQQDTLNEVSTLYVGNLPYKADEEAVQEHFEQQGNVVSVRLMKDRRTGKRKGYGFVEMNASGAAKAIKNLNDSIFQERMLKVRFAKDKVQE